MSAEGSTQSNFVTLSSFLLLPAGRTYQAWLRQAGDWVSLGTVAPDANGNGRLIAEREPFYQHADLTIWSRDVPHEKIVDECVDALHARLCGGGAALPPKDTTDRMDATG